MRDRGLPLGGLGLMALLCGLHLLLFTFGCGRKAPPEPPQAPALPVVSGLTAGRVDGEGGALSKVTLSWSMAPLTGRLAREARFAIYRDTAPLGEGECPNCPPRFERVAQLPYDPSAPRVDGALVFEYTETVATGFRYRYQVALRLDKGRQGDPSETVEVRLE